MEKGSTIVGVLTGNGLKDPETAIMVNEEKSLLSREQFDTLLNELKEGAKVMGEADFSVVVPATTANLGPVLIVLGLRSLYI